MKLFRRNNSGTSANGGTTSQSGGAEGPAGSAMADNSGVSTTEELNQENTSSTAIAVGNPSVTGVGADNQTVDVG